MGYVEQVAVEGHALHARGRRPAALLEALLLDELAAIVVDGDKTAVGGEELLPARVEGQSSGAFEAGTGAARVVVLHQLSAGVDNPCVAEVCFVMDDQVRSVIGDGPQVVEDTRSGAQIESVLDRSILCVNLVQFARVVKEKWIELVGDHPERPGQERYPFDLVAGGIVGAVAAEAGDQSAGARVDLEYLVVHSAVYNDPEGLANRRRGRGERDANGIVGDGLGKESLIDNPFGTG